MGGWAGDEGRGAGAGDCNPKPLQGATKTRQGVKGATVAQLNGLDLDQREEHEFYRSPVVSWPRNNSASHGLLKQSRRQTLLLGQL